MRRKLVLSDGTRERELMLVGRIVVGRDPACEISHDDSLLSRRHAEFITDGDVVTVRDLGSRNGIFVNGARSVEQVLAPGDVVQIGPLRARFVVEDSTTIIMPEAADVDRTAVIRKAFAPPQAAEPARPAAVEDDQDVTRMVPAPRFPAAAAAERPYSSLPVDDADAPTRFISAPEVSLGTVTGVPATGAPGATGASDPRAERDVGGFRVFIFGRVLMGAALILAGAAFPVLLWSRALVTAGIEGRAAMPLTWFAPSIGIALVAAYLVANSIHRRVAGALAGGERTGS